MDDNISIEFSCVNCGQVFVVSKHAALYCSQRCHEDAKLVRYARACIKDGRINDPLVYNAIRTREAFAYSKKGYYDEKARRVAREVRTAVTELDKGLCRMCGAVGTDVDHIDGDSNDLDNLQLLCDDCHDEKTRSNMAIVAPGDERYEEVRARASELWSRIESPVPLRPCDDEANWNDLYPQLLAEQRRLLRQIKEDAEGAGKGRDPVEEEWIESQLDELSDLRRQIEDLGPQKQARVDEILSPEVRAQLEAIETEFAEREEALEQTFDELKKKIGERVSQYGSTVKGELFQAVFARRKATWDYEGLDEYSKMHPEILQFRIEGKCSASIRSVKRK